MSEQVGGGEMVSFGAGVNSVAMVILLVEEGWRGPIVFADTGGEHPETYCYLRYFQREYLEPRGLEITRLSPTSDMELYDTRRSGKTGATLEEYCLMQGIIPLLAVRWCSVQFKRQPLEAWREAHGLEVAFLGIADDEAQRVRQDPSVAYPLCERAITRAECMRIIQRVDLEVPRKSGCFFCPGQRLSQWRDLWLNHLDLFERAVALEENASQHCQKNATLDPHGVPLEEMVARRWQGLVQMDLSAWIPCVCKL